MFRCTLIFAIAAAASSFPISELPARFTAILAQPDAARATWGVLVHSSRLGVLYDANANKSFVPASNTKLLMGSAALLALGEDYEFETRTFASTARDGAPLVCFQPGGDPSFGDPSLALLVNRTAAALAPASRAAAQLRLSLPPVAHGATPGTAPRLSISMHEAS